MLYLQVMLLTSVDHTFN